MDELKVRQLFDYDTWTYTYLVWCPNSRDCLLIDPFYEQVDRDLNLIYKLNLSLKYILETHVHADHITGADKIRRLKGVKVCYGSSTGVKGADIYLEDNQKLSLGKGIIKSIHTPGHTSGCVSYYTKGYIFTGDTLFIEGTGRTDFQEGSASNTYESVRNKIFSYSDETLIYPGHNYNGFTCSTILEEKISNPNVGLDISKEQFLDSESKKERPYPKRFDVAVPANMQCGKVDK